MITRNAPAPRVIEGRPATNASQRARPAKDAASKPAGKASGIDGQDQPEPGRRQKR